MTRESPCGKHLLKLPAVAVIGIYTELASAIIGIYSLTGTKRLFTIVSNKNFNVHVSIVIEQGA